MRMKRQKKGMKSLIDRTKNQISKIISLKLTISFMFHKQNSNCEKLIAIYNQFETILSEEK